MVRNKKSKKNILNKVFQKGNFVWAKLGAILVLMFLLWILFPKNVLPETMNKVSMPSRPEISTMPTAALSTVLATSLPKQVVTDYTMPLTITPIASQSSSTPLEPSPKVEQVDTRVQALSDYLAQRNSPLTNYAADFIEAADTYGIDWKLVPAISGVESTFGIHIPGGHYPSTTSYNGWGWGVYGNHVMKFASWREAIFTITKGLKENYISRGLTTPAKMNHVYAASPTWGVRVAFFLKDIDQFAQKYTGVPVVADNS